MNTNTNNPTTVLSRWTRFLGAMLTVALMVPAVAFSQPAAPVLNLPADLATNVSTTPTYSWSAVAGDSVYHLQISTSNVFADTVYNDSTLTGVSRVSTGLKNATTYYWHVSVKVSFSVGGGTSAYSTARSFTTWASTPAPSPAPLPVTLGSTYTFAILSYAGVTNILNSSITGDVGVSPTTGASMTGFNTVALAGTIYTVDAAAPIGWGGAYVIDPTRLTQAMGDLTIAYNDAAGRTVNPIGVSGNLGGRTLYSGLYKSTSTLEVSSGDLTLDGQGDANAVWIFQIASSFNMTSGRQVFLSGGAKASNIFWQVGSAATFGTTAVMKGTIMAGTNITFATGASLEGRALAKTASVTLQGNVIGGTAESPLPVELVAFTATANRLNADLRWSTATEVNNYGFEIERRQTATWEKVGFVTGAGTSSSPRDYSYTDNNLSPGRYAYRIKQLDNDGTFSYHGSAEVEIGLAAKKFQLESNYPNPFNPSTTIQFTLADDGVTSLRVYNMLGQNVMTLFEGNAQAGRLYQVKFDASSLPSGLYFAKLESGKQQMMQKMTLMK